MCTHYRFMQRYTTKFSDYWPKEKENLTVYFPSVWHRSISFIRSFPLCFSFYACYDFWFHRTIIKTLLLILKFTTFHCNICNYNYVYWYVLNWDVCDISVSFQSASTTSIVESLSIFVQRSAKLLCVLGSHHIN